MRHIWADIRRAVISRSFLLATLGMAVCLCPIGKEAPLPDRWRRQGQAHKRPPSRDSDRRLEAHKNFFQKRFHTFGCCLVMYICKDKYVREDNVMKGSCEMKKYFS